VSGVARGVQFRLLLRQMLDSSPVLSGGQRESQKLFIHPGALLMALVAASFVLSSSHDAPFHDGAPPANDSSILSFFARLDITILSAVAIAAAWLEREISSAFPIIQDLSFKDGDLLNQTGDHRCA